MGEVSAIHVMEKPLVEPSDYLYIRDNGHGVFSISVPPDRLQEFAEALSVLFTLYSNKGRSQALMDIVVDEAG